MLPSTFLRSSLFYDLSWRVLHSRLGGAAKARDLLATSRQRNCSYWLLVAEQRKEDLKLLETAAAGGEDGKAAKLLVPKAIDADDADDTASDDDSDDGDSVRQLLDLAHYSTQPSCSSVL